MASISGLIGNPGQRLFSQQGRAMIGNDGGRLSKELVSRGVKPSNAVASRLQRQRETAELGRGSSWKKSKKRIQPN